MSFLLRYSIYIAIIFFMASCTPRGDMLNSAVTEEKLPYNYLFQNDLEYSIVPSNCRKRSRIPELYDILNLKKDLKDSLYVVSFRQNERVTSFVQCIKSNEYKELSYYLINSRSNSVCSKVLLSLISYAVNETINLSGCSIDRNGFCHYFTTYDKQSRIFTLWAKDKMSEIHAEFGGDRCYGLTSSYNKSTSIPVKTWLSDAKKVVTNDKDEYTVLARYCIDQDGQILGL